MKPGYRGYNRRVQWFSKLILFALLALLPVAHVVCADEIALKMDFLDSIKLDEDENSLQWPSFVTVDPVSNEIYVIDRKNRFIIYTPDLFPIFTVGLEKGIKQPMALAVDMEGNIYVSLSGDDQDNTPNRIAVFDVCLRHERDIILSGFKDAETFKPYRMVVDSEGRLLVTGVNDEGLLVLDNNGVLLYRLYPESTAGKRLAIQNVSRDSDGRIYLTSNDSGEIFVYDEHFDYLYKFGEKGGGPGKLSRPGNVAVDKAVGQMYVSDAMRHTVVVYDLAGKYIYEFGGKGWGNGWLQYPREVAVDKDGRVLVADTFNDRISIFFPAKMPLDSKQKLFLADRLKGKISLSLPGKPTLDTRERIIDKIKDKITLYKLFDKLSLYTPENVPSPASKNKGYIIYDIFNDKVSLRVPGKIPFEDKKWLLISDTIIDKFRAGRPIFASVSTGANIPWKPTLSTKTSIVDRFRDKISRYTTGIPGLGNLGDFIIRDAFTDKVSLNVPGKVLFDSKRWLLITDTITDKVRAGRPVYASAETPESNAPAKQYNISGKLNLDTQAKIVDRITEKIAGFTTRKQAPANLGDFNIQDAFTEKVSLNVPGKVLFDSRRWLLISDTITDKVRAGKPVYASSEIPKKDVPVKKNNVSGKLNLDAQAKIIDRVTDKIADYTVRKQPPENLGDFIIQDNVFSDTALLSVPARPLIYAMDPLLISDKIQAGIPFYAFSELSIRPESEKERRQ